MKKVIYILAALLCCSCVSKSKYENEISYLEDRISDLEQEKEELEEQVEELDDILDRAYSKVKDADFYYAVDEYFLASISVSSALRILNER